METRNLAELYDLALLDWAPIAARLEKGYSQAPGSGGPDRHSTWLATINPDGSPHVTGIGAMWVDGAAWFVTAESTRKGRNLARDPRCSLSVATQEFDLVFEGDAHKVTDRATVSAMCDVFHDDGWPCRLDDSGLALTAEFSAPSAGPPPWHVYSVTPRAATALNMEPSGATRWRF